MGKLFVRKNLKRRQTDKVSQTGVIDIGISDHQLIYCTRKVNRQKTGKHKEITIRSLKNYTPESFREALGNDPFPNYEEYTDINTAYNDFVTRLQTTINDIAPLKSIRIKNTTPEWFDGEIADKISMRDNLFKKFKSNKLEINNELYLKAKREVQSLIKKKKK